MPSLRGGAVNTNRVQLSTSPALDNLDPCTIACWVWLEVLSGGRMYTKGTGLPQSLLGSGVDVNNVLTCNRGRGAGTPTQVEADWANFVSGGSFKWMFCVGQYDTVTVGNCQLFVGDLWAPPTPPSSYRIQTVGAGTVGTQVGTTADLMNAPIAQTFAMTGLQAWLAVWNRLLTPAELIDVQQQSLRGRDMITPGLRGMWRPGEDGDVVVLDRSAFGTHGLVVGPIVDAQTPFIPNPRASVPYSLFSNTRVTRRLSRPFPYKPSGARR